MAVTSKKPQKKQKAPLSRKPQGELVFALDIGTRSIIGIVGKVEGDLFNVLAIESEEHTKRSMKDGQIENIDQVAQVAKKVKKRLEDKLGVTLKKVCIAAAGRTLRTQKASYEIQLEQTQYIDKELISRLEVGAVSAAEEAFNKESFAEDEEAGRGFFLVGYSVLSYFLDNFNISSLKDHRGKNLRAEIIATFLPAEVVDSLYMTMQKCDLEVTSLTLEPIAAINAAIPQDLRLLNLALVDIGAGTSDIAVCRDGGITGYTMATVAGDEITETIMKQYLVDFGTAEMLKMQYSEKDIITFTNILGFEESVKKEELTALIREPLENLSKEIVRCVEEINNGVPSAIFLAGGGSKLAGLKEAVSEHLNMESRRVAIAGGNFRLSAFSDKYDLNNPEYATPLGIAVSSGLNLLHDSLQILLNSKPAKVFKSGELRIIDVLMMNGYGYSHILGHSGKGLAVTFEGKRKVFYGERPLPAVLKLNGEPAVISDTVQSGDKVEFVPAVSGDDARPAAAALIPADFNMDGWEIYINDERVLPETLLENGDEVSLRKVRRKEETDVSEETKPSEDAEEIAIVEADRPAEPEKTAELSEPEAPEEPAESSKAEEQDGPAESAASEKSAEPAAETVAVAKASNLLYITLNDKPMEMPPKPDDQPYYLMDMLNYSELDFDNVNESVVLRVNGEDSNFLRELKNGDIIEIR
ncbi:MAG: pilus assembly protein PilM [Firmicutes bacterium]|nr:pilus assembly protein PilM [Bacillota bacterium]